MVVGDLTQKPIDEIYDARRDPDKGSRNEQLNEDLPFDSRAGMSVRHYFPLDAEYVFKVRFIGNQAADDREDVKPYDVRVAVSAGLHTVGVTSPRENQKSENEAPAGGRGGGTVRQPSPVDLRLDGARLRRLDVPGATPEVARLIIAGPYLADRPWPAAEPRARVHLPSCEHSGRARVRPAHSDQPRALCVSASRDRRRRRSNLRLVRERSHRPRFRRRHWQCAAGDPGLAGVSVPHRADPAAAPGSPAVRVNDVDLASRLSFFLWSSIPDATLLGLAERGTLSEPAVLRRQVQRMLDDPKSDALVSNFAGQWLHVRNVETVRPDPRIFPFDEALRQAFAKETELLVSSIVRDDRSLLDLLDADYTFLNQRLAEHYGVPNIYGSQFRRVAVTDRIGGV